MPSPNLLCEVRTEGGVFTNWLTVAVSQSFSEPSWNRHFRLTCAEPAGALLQRLVPGQRVDIALAGKVVVKEGYIKTRQAAFDANRHGVQIDGYSKAGPISEVSARSGTGQFRGYTLEQIANGVLKPHGIKFRLEKPPQGADLPFPNIVIRHGETPFSLISRLAWQRGLWLHAEADGTIVGQGSGTQAGIVFEEGRNILSGNCTITMPSVDRIVVDSQQPGSDSLFGRKAAEVSAATPTSGGLPGLERRVIAEMPLDQAGAQLRASMEAQAIEATLLHVSLSYQGWLHPGGDLWGMREFVTVRSPTLFPTATGELELRLWGYTYSQTPEGQTVTAIELVNRAAFAEKFPQATAPDKFFNRQISPAQPEAFT